MQVSGVPCGATQSYEKIAHAVGSPHAVGFANGFNRIAIPCHRVVRKDRTRGIYGGGLWRKRKLLAMEQIAVD